MSRLDPNWRALQNLADKRPWNGKHLNRSEVQGSDTFFPNGAHTLGVCRDGKPIGYADLQYMLGFNHVCAWLETERIDEALAWAIEAHPIGQMRNSPAMGDETPREVYAVAIEGSSVWVWLAGIGRVLATQVEVPR